MPYSNDDTVKHHVASNMLMCVCTICVWACVWFDVCNGPLCESLKLTESKTLLSDAQLYMLKLN